MKNKILITGNEAIGEAAIIAGCRFYAGYPITPQNELTAYMAKRMKEMGGVFIQAESEIAAVNMVFGASVTGARAMTSSSSPGISLKQEGISYLAGCELPAVIINIMRGGPGLGNISPSQADYFQATKGGGHGDYHCIVLAPSTVQEAMDLTILAFDLADIYRTPVIILGDGMLGQMMEPIEKRKAQSLPAGRQGEKRKTFEKSWALTGAKNRKPNIIRSLYLGEGVLEELNIRLQKRYQEITQKEKRFEVLNLDDAEVILTAYGSMARICKSVVQDLRKEGVKVGFIRPISLWPFPSEVFARAAERVKNFLVVEMSSGQMLEDVQLAVGGKAKIDFYGRMGGGIPEEEEIIKRIKNIIK
ncbi:MAG: 3-methyl-2-oxobutanoate dehydrogenase subunit VorB [Candidatus Omnitrophota bacterium]|nr:3-methyl-2-oxobutanoate dehydrogenase subunit VorB [Candidatus Omnitrophota bacterium]